MDFQFYLITGKGARTGDILKLISSKNGGEESVLLQKCTLVILKMKKFLSKLMIHFFREGTYI